MFSTPQQDVPCDASVPSPLVLGANAAVKTSVNMLTVMQGSWEVRATRRLIQGSRLMLRGFFGQNALMVAQINVTELILHRFFVLLGVTSMDGFLDDYFPSVAAKQEQTNIKGNLYCQYDSQVGSGQALSTVTATFVP